MTEIKDTDNLLVDAKNYLIQGRRHLLVNDFEAAVESLQEACKLYDVKYGTAAKECGDPYLTYGTALLELARLETGAVGGVVNSKIEEDDDEDDEDDDEEEDDDDDEQDETDKPTEGGEAAPSTDAQKKPSEEEDLDKSKEMDDAPSPPKAPESSGTPDSEKAIPAPTAESSVAGSSSSSGPSASSSSAVDAPVASGSSSAPVASSSSSSTSALDPSQPSTSSGTGQQDSADATGDASMEGDNEATDMEIAWETLVVAQSIFEKHCDSDPSLKIKLAETWMKLGEISVEWENYENAIDLLSRCLSLRKELLPEDDRLIAEAYYYMGLAFSLKDPENYIPANDAFHSAIEVFELRIRNLTKRIESPAESSDVTATSDAPSLGAWVEKAQREIDDLRSLIVEIRGRIEDSNDQMLSAKKALEEVAREDAVDTEAAAKAEKLKDAPVQNISHLIKRKRPDGEAEASPVKEQAAAEHPATNGNGDSAEVANVAKKLCTGEAPNEATPVVEEHNGATNGN